MVVDNVLKRESGGQAKVIQALAYRGYRLVEPLATAGNSNTYVVQDNRKPEGCYCLVRISPMAKSQHVSSPETLPAASILPNTAQLLETFQIDGYSYLIRQYIHGNPLTWEIPTQEGWPDTQVINLLTTILSILKQCHQQGIVHGNLYPNNLIRQPDGNLVLTDFKPDYTHLPFPGDHPQNRLKSNILGQLGRQAYIAPEQWQKHYQPSSDIYATGILGIQFLLGRQSWTSEEQLTHLLSMLPYQPLVTMLKRMVDPAPGQRYINAQEALFALENLQPQEQSNFSNNNYPEESPLASALPDSSFKIPVVPNTLPVAEPQLTKFHQTSPEPHNLQDISTVKQPEFLSQNVAPQQLIAPKLTGTNTAVMEPMPLVAIPSVELSVVAPSNPDPVLILEERQDPLLISEQIQEEHPQESSSSTLACCLKWTSAVLALTASAGGIFWYHKEVYSDQTATIASDIPESLPSELETNDTDQPPKPLPVPASPNSIDTTPRFSQSQENQYFTRAYHHAKASNFSKALVYLEQIPQDAERYLEAQEKITEYQNKREIKAQALLSDAYEQAASKNFEQALSYLYQIPAHTEAHRVAIEKITEYRDKQQLQASIQPSLG